MRKITNTKILEPDGSVTYRMVRVFDNLRITCDYTVDPIQDRVSTAVSLRMARSELRTFVLTKIGAHQATKTERISGSVAHNSNKPKGESHEWNMLH